MLLPDADSGELSPGDARAMLAFLAGPTALAARQVLRSRWQVDPTDRPVLLDLAATAMARSAWSCAPGWAGVLDEPDRLAADADARRTVRARMTTREGLPEPRRTGLELVRAARPVAGRQLGQRLREADLTVPGLRAQVTDRLAGHVTLARRVGPEWLPLFALAGAEASPARHGTPWWAEQVRAHWDALPGLAQQEPDSGGPAAWLLARPGVREQTVLNPAGLPRGPREALVLTGLGQVRLARHSRPLPEVPHAADALAAAAFLAC